MQANVSASAAGVVRGLHLHRRQLDRWIVASGRAFVALVDVRPMLDPVDPSPTPLVETRVLETDDWVDIPIGVAHGFLALEPLDLLYLVTNEYDGTDELGFAWDDPTRGDRVAGHRHARRPADPVRARPRESHTAASWSPPYAADRSHPMPDPSRTRPTGTDARPKGLRAPGPSRD